MREVVINTSLLRIGVARAKRRESILAFQQGSWRVRRGGRKRRGREDIT